MYFDYGNYSNVGKANADLFRLKTGSADDALQVESFNSSASTQPVLSFRYKPLNEGFHGLQEARIDALAKIDDFVNNYKGKKGKNLQAYCKQECYMSGFPATLDHVFEALS